ncbi:RidA/YER057c/UK114 superfamily, group 1 [hydrothermal vent metagenome]|uniref:RidA/YER057c/UK114 superfamily, group 1 n=1 Tax=hydrothermal vent metagenome TaxID=652676 RepID=A0A3B0RG07_9ZZZZ
MSNPNTRLAELGITLPKPAAPIANYLPFVRSGNMVFVSGQIAAGPDGVVLGTLGKDMDIAAGKLAARLCAINLLAQIATALDDDLSRVRRVVRLGGFVQTTPDFTDIPHIINGASDLMVEVFADAGRHARFAVGCSSLPLGTAVEIDGMFEVD